MKTKWILLCWAICLGNWAAQAQIDRNQYTLFAKKTTQKVEIDGLAQESDWQAAGVAKNFYQNFPFDSSYALRQTEVRILYDDQNLYVHAICYGQSPQEYVISSLRRDFGLGNADFFATYFDTFEDATNGFSFVVNPLGVQREGLLADGGTRGAEVDWDNRWFAKTHQGADFWSVEMAIPFKTFRYKQGAQEWFVNFGRADLYHNEQSSWIPVPRTFNVSNLGFTGKLVFETPLPKPGANVSIIPYLTGGFSQNPLTGQADKYTRNVGGDAKIALTPSLSLDLTVNPDFSQVEVDQQVTNLDRFEIFFPERRQFFLENADLFSRFGFSRIRPFFSRRIGVGIDSTTGQNVQNPILFGARLSGKVNRNWRVGFLNMQTATDEAKGILGSNYTVATFQRQTVGRSNVGAIFVNRQVTTDSTGDFSLNTNNYNRVVGLDYNLLSKDNKWTGKFFYHQLLTPEQRPEQYAHASYINYNTPIWSINWNHEFVGRDYRPQVGFVPRNNHWRLEPSVFYSIYPKRSPTINRHRLGLYTNFYWNTDGDLTDRYVELSYAIFFADNSRIEAWGSKDFVKLFSAFDPTNSGGERLPVGSTYDNYQGFVEYASNPRRFFTYSASLSFGEFFNGRNVSISGGVGYRFQPFGSISLSVNHNQIRLPEPYKSADFWLVGPRLDVSFSQSLFWTTFFQYNNQIDNININTRLQWRFAPVSDLFVVYTDNYFPENLEVKNRALVLKLTYWLNL